MSEYDQIKIHDGTQELSQYENEDTLMRAETDAQAMAEVKMQAALAFQRPRNEAVVMEKLRRVCQHKSFADVITFNFKRGTTDVGGETIHLARELARIWGNFKYYWKVVFADDEKSTVETVAWDLETNAISSRRFDVRHWRDTRSGGYAIDNERDKYELIANMASRRLRACIFELLPKYMIEYAKKECYETIKREDPRSQEDRIIAMLEAFQELGVNADMIKDYLGYEPMSMAYSQFIKLARIYKDIEKGITTTADVFIKTNDSSELPKHPEDDSTPSGGEEDNQQTKMEY